VHTRVRGVVEPVTELGIQFIERELCQVESRKKTLADVAEGTFDLSFGLGAARAT